MGGWARWRRRPPVGEAVAMADASDSPVAHGSHAVGHQVPPDQGQVPADQGHGGHDQGHGASHAAGQGHGDQDPDHGLGSHASGHDEHDAHGSGGDAWVLIPLAAGVVIAIVLIAIFALQSQAPPLT